MCVCVTEQRGSSCQSVLSMLPAHPSQSHLGQGPLGSSSLKALSVYSFSPMSIASLSGVQSGTEGSWHPRTSPMRLGSSYHSRSNRCGLKNPVPLRELVPPQSTGSLLLVKGDMDPSSPPHPPPYTHSTCRAEIKGTLRRPSEHVSQ